MASLGKISELLKINSPPSTKMHPVEPPIENPKKFIARKRRAWLEDEPAETSTDVQIPKASQTLDYKEVNKPLIEKGAIAPLNKPATSTPFIDVTDQPHCEKRFIEGAYKPLFLSFEDLRSNPLNMIMYFYEITKDEENRKSKRITMSELILALHITRDSARTALRFLMKQGCINRTDLKVGKHGWSQYSINETIFEQIKKAIDKGSITPFRRSEFLEGHKGFNSSNNLNNTTTNFSKKSGFTLPAEWDAIDIEPLRQIRFSKSHILQIFREGTLTPEMVQDSLYAFAFDLYENKRIEKYGDPLRVIMGVFRDGIPYNAPSNYESPKDKARREHLENLRRADKKREEEEKEIIDLEFKQWSKSIPEEEMKKIVHPFTPTSAGFWPSLKEFFKNKIWPERKREIYGNT
ncbi:MAG: hypothetical protein SFW07_05760 [Gammaproteobacteria bacterium]|nr:hypothetical protein [Gammaproteobacteria bacterium]